MESIWPNLFASALEGKDIGSLICNVGSGVAAAPAAAGDSGQTEAKEEKKEVAKEESEEESDDDMGFGKTLRVNYGSFYAVCVCVCTCT